MGKRQNLKPVMLEDIIEYNLTLVFTQYDNHKDVVRDIIIPYEDSEIYKNLKPMDGAYRILKKLKDDGYELCVITSRGDNLYEFTLSYLKKHFEGIFEEKNVWFNKHFQGKKMSKGDVCREMGLLYMVDDALFQCNGVSEATDHKCTSFLFGVTPWDNDDSKFNKNVFRALNWDSLYEKMMKMEKKK